MRCVESIRHAADEPGLDEKPGSYRRARNAEPASKGAFHFWSFVTRQNAGSQLQDIGVNGPEYRHVQQYRTNPPAWAERRTVIAKPGPSMASSASTTSNEWRRPCRAPREASSRELRGGRVDESEVRGIERGSATAVSSGGASRERGSSRAVPANLGGAKPSAKSATSSESPRLRRPNSAGASPREPDAPGLADASHIANWGQWTSQVSNGDYTAIELMSPEGLGVFNGPPELPIKTSAESVLRGHQRRRTGR